MCLVTDFVFTLKHISVVKALSRASQSHITSSHVDRWGRQDFHK